MGIVLKVHKKGIVVLPKALREQVGIEEGSEVLAEIVGDSIVLKPLKPKVVDIDPEEVRKLIEEEKKEWEQRLERLVEEISS